MNYFVPLRKKGPLSIYLLRHAESEGNARGRDDNSLKHKANHQFQITKKGRGEAQQVKEFIKSQKYIDAFTEIYTTTFLRAQETTHHIFRNKPVIIDPRLDEW